MPATSPTSLRCQAFRSSSSPIAPLSRRGKRDRSGLIPAQKAHGINRIRITPILRPVFHVAAASSPCQNILFFIAWIPTTYPRPVAPPTTFYVLSPASQPVPSSPATHRRQENGREQAPGHKSHGFRPNQPYPPFAPFPCKQRDASPTMAPALVLSRACATRWWWHNARQQTTLYSPVGGNLAAR